MKTLNAISKPFVQGDLLGMHSVTKTLALQTMYVVHMGMGNIKQIKQKTTEAINKTLCASHSNSEKQTNN